MYHSRETQEMILVHHSISQYGFGELSSGSIRLISSELCALIENLENYPYKHVFRAKLETGDG